MYLHNLLKNIREPLQNLSHLKVSKKASYITK